jgi:hypothetical protein
MPVLSSFAAVLTVVPVLAVAAIVWHTSRGVASSLRLEKSARSADTTTRQTEAFFNRSHKVIVALTVKEILDEHIAKKLA